MITTLVTQGIICCYSYNIILSALLLFTLTILSSRFSQMRIRYYGKRVDAEESLRQSLDCYEWTCKAYLRHWITSL